MDATGNQMADRRDVGSHFALRRIPKQERSRERIDEILKVAMDLIGQKGIDAVTMKEIASLSGGPIASVYQYFPTRRQSLPHSTSVTFHNCVRSWPARCRRSTKRVALPMLPKR